MNDSTREGNKSIGELKRLTATQEVFKIAFKLEHAESVLKQAELQEKRTQVKIEANKGMSATVREIEEMGSRNFITSRVSFSEKEVDYLKSNAIAYFSARHEAEYAIKELIEYKQYNTFYKNLDQKYEKLNEKFQDLQFKHERLRKKS